MILDFADRTTEDIFHGRTTRFSLKLSRAFWPRVLAKLDLLNACVSLEDLKAPPSNRLERLKGRLSDFYSIRVNDQYRIIFKFDGKNCRAVQCVDYH
jgi:toxin HigB-1